MSRLPRIALATLVAGAFVSQLGYAIAQPLLPYLLERGDQGVSENTGLLTATYAGAIVIFAPLWGRLSDHWPRRSIYLAGIGGLFVALLILSFVGSLAALYSGLFLAGAFSGAIWPIALAIVADCEPDQRSRARSFGRIYVGVTAGLLTGPAIGGLLGRMWTGGMPVTGLPFLAAAAAAMVVLLASVLSAPARSATPPARSASTATDRGRLRLLILLSLLVSWGLGTFEVGLTLRAAQDFALGPNTIGWMFVECMIVMIITQLLVFNRRVNPSFTRLLLVPSFALLGLALLFVGFAPVPGALVAAVATSAAALGVILPVIGYWISFLAGDVQGTQLGWQASAASLGQALGAAAAGLLFGMDLAAGAFVLAAMIVLLGAALALPLSRRLTALIAPLERLARGAASAPGRPGRP